MFVYIFRLIESRYPKYIFLSEKILRRDFVMSTALTRRHRFFSLRIFVILHKIFCPFFNFSYHKMSREKLFLPFVSNLEPDSNQ